jgi:hypothetical protein
MDVCLVLSVCVLCCVGSGLAAGWSPVQWVLPTACKILNFRINSERAQAREPTPSKKKNKNKKKIFLPAYVGPALLSTSRGHSTWIWRASYLPSGQFIPTFRDALREKCLNRCILRRLLIIRVWLFCTFPLRLFGKGYTEKLDVFWYRFGFTMTKERESDLRGQIMLKYPPDPQSFQETRYSLTPVSYDISPFLKLRAQ